MPITYLPLLFVKYKQYYLLFIPKNAHIYVTILNCITNAPTCFVASAPFSGSSDVVFVNVIKY
jgi:hypothetical protein